jgi:hypothetical protein
VRDRLSFTQFLRLGFEDGIPDGTTLGCSVRAGKGWRDREAVRAFGLTPMRAADNCD